MGVAPALSGFPWLVGITKRVRIVGWEHWPPINIMQHDLMLDRDV